jgi:hypothetical protein
MSAGKQISNNNLLSHKQISEIFHKIFRIGLGTALLMHEERKAISKKMKDFRKQAEIHGRNRLEEFKEHRHQKTDEILENKLEQFQKRMDIPTKSDLEKLSNKITELSMKLDEMQ